MLCSRCCHASTYLPYIDNECTPFFLQHLRLHPVKSVNPANYSRTLNMLADETVNLTIKADKIVLKRVIDLRYK